MHPNKSMALSVPVAIYARVSTLNQVGGRFDSCESQAAICREYLERHAVEGWHEVACFSDPAYSGRSMNRPGMQALMRRIEAGDVRIVLVFKFERVLRSTDEWAPFRAFLEKHDCRLLSTTEDLTESTPSGRLKNNLLVSVAEYERLNTAEKVRAKLREQAKRGYWSCGLVPYGYNYNSAQQALHPHPEEAAAVSRIFEQAANLISLSDIANALSADGIRTKSRVFRRRDGTRTEVGGVRFRSDTLRWLIRNPIYAGRVRMHGLEYPGRHEALVAPDLWERANAAIRRPGQPARHHLNVRDKHFHLLKGVLFCGCCHRAMIPNVCGKRDPDGRPYRYYTCGRAHKERTDAMCPVRHVSATAVETAIIGFLGACSRHPEVLRAAEESSRLRTKADRAPLRAAFDATRRSLSDVDQQLRNCAEAVTSGGLAAIADELRERAATLKHDKERLLVTCERLRQDIAAGEQDRLDTPRLRQALERFHQVLPTLSPSEQRNLVTLVIARTEIFPAPDDGANAGVGGRQFSLRLKLHLARLVEGMEECVVVETQGSKVPAPPARLLGLDMKFASVTRSGGPTVVLTPLRLEVGPLQRHPAVALEPGGRHPIHRALAWQRKLSTNPGLTQRRLAAQEHVAAGTLTHHLKLLQLAPEVRIFLLNLHTSADLRAFSLNRMKAFAEIPPDRQLREFVRLKRQLRPSAVEPADNDQPPSVLLEPVPETVAGAFRPTRHNKDSGRSQPGELSRHRGSREAESGAQVQGCG